MWLIALVTTAIAGPSGYYHPFDLQQGSELFREASNGVRAGWESGSRTSLVVSRSLDTYRQSLDLLGDRSPTAEHERLSGLKTQYNREFAVLQAFTDAVIEDVDTEFKAAVKRAIAKLGATAVECEKEISDGPRVPGMRGRTKPNPECIGEDLNLAIAEALDADPLLETAVAEITALKWPTITLTKEAIDPIGGPRYIDARDFFTVAAREAMKSIDRADDDARMVFEAAIEEGADLSAHLEAAKGVTAATAASRAALAAPTLEAIDDVWAKWVGKGEIPTGWCANPYVFGGCKGEEATNALTDRLLEEKKVAKTLR